MSILPYRKGSEKPERCFNCDAPVPAGIAYTGGWITLSFPHTPYGEDDVLAQDFCSFRCAVEGVQAHIPGEEHMAERKGLL